MPIKYSALVGKGTSRRERLKRHHGGSGSGSCAGTGLGKVIGRRTRTRHTAPLQNKPASTTESLRGRPRPIRGGRRGAAPRRTRDTRLQVSTSSSMEGRGAAHDPRVGRARPDEARRGRPMLPATSTGTVRPAGRMVRSLLRLVPERSDWEAIARGADLRDNGTSPPAARRRRRRMPGLFAADAVEGIAPARRGARRQRRHRRRSSAFGDDIGRVLRRARRQPRVGEPASALWRKYNRDAPSRFSPMAPRHEPEIS